MKRYFPLLVTVLGFVGIGALAIARITALLGTAMFVPALVAFLGYVAWLTWESHVSVRETENHEADSDRGTMEFAAFAKVSLLVAALLPESAARPLVALLGIACMIVGIVIRMAAIRTLGEHYGHRIRRAAHIITAGPYRVIRHPAYLGTLLAHVGFVLVFLNGWSVAALFALWVPAVVVRTVLEDQFLRATPEYDAYADRVRARLFPGLF